MADSADEDVAVGGAGDGGGFAAAASGRRGEEDEYSGEEEELMRRELFEKVKSNPKDLKRYRYFRRSRIRPEHVLQQIRPVFQNREVPEEIVLTLACTAKMFVGELVEDARKLMDEDGARGPVTPTYIRMAYQAKLRAGAIPYARHMSHSHLLG